MHDDTLDHADEQLLAELAALHTVLDPVPPGLTDDVRFAITVQSMHAEIAELVATPALAVRDDDLDGALAAGTDTITFTSGDVALMIAVDATDPDGLTIDGWVTTGGVEVTVHAGDGQRTVVADEHGRFVVTGAQRGRTWFVVGRGPGDDRPPIVTPPVEL